MDSLCFEQEQQQRSRWRQPDWLDGWRPRRHNATSTLIDQLPACRVLILMREICKLSAAVSVERETSANRHLASQTSSWESSALYGMLFVFVPNLNIPMKVSAAFDLAFAPLSWDYSQCAKSIILVESTDGIRHYLPCWLVHKLALCVTMPR